MKHRSYIRIPIWFHTWVYITRRPLRLVSPSSQRYYADRRFRRRAHATLLSRQLGRCAVCRQPLQKGNAEIHHLIPQGIRPDLAKDIDNLILLCHQCHQVAHGHQPTPPTPTNPHHPSTTR